MFIKIILLNHDFCFYAMFEGICLVCYNYILDSLEKKEITVVSVFCVMVSMLISSVVDRVFEPRLYQTKE